MQDYRIWLVEDADDLVALRQPWTAMLAEAQQVAIFLTWEWVHTCWRHGAPGRLWLLTAWDRDDELAGVAPLTMVEERQGPLHVRRLAFLGDRPGAPLHLDFAARHWDREAVLAAFVRYLCDNPEEWDVLDLAGLAPSSLLGSCLAQAPGRLLACAGEPAPSLILPPTWESFAAQQLNTHQRTHLWHWQEQLDGAYPGQVLFRRVSEARELPDALGTLAAFPGDAPAAGAGTPTSPCQDAPDPEFVELAMRHGWLHLYTMEIAGQTVAAACNFLYRGLFTSYRLGCSPTWAQYRVGALLRAYTIHQAISLGARQFDLLPGFRGHHAAWTQEVRQDKHLMLSMGWRGHAWLWRSAALATARRVTGTSVRA